MSNFPHRIFGSLTTFSYSRHEKLIEAIAFPKKSIKPLMEVRGSCRQFKHPVKIGRITRRSSGRPATDAPIVFTLVLRQPFFLPGAR
jgi:hypothetical protein